LIPFNPTVESNNSIIRNNVIKDEGIQKSLYGGKIPVALLTRYLNVLFAILIGAILGVILSIAFGYWLWFPLMVGVCFLFSFFCQETSDIPEEQGK
jgi:hypothetical protein